MGLACKIFGHKWDWCKCKKCDQMRDEQHNWENGKCNVCGIKQSVSMQSSNQYTNKISPIQHEVKTEKDVVSELDLFETAKNDKNSDVRRAAIKKITNQDLLTAIAINACEESNNIGLDTIVAYKKVKNVNNLSEIARKAKDFNVRAHCCMRLEDTKILEKIAKEDSDEPVREAANSKLKIINERKSPEHEPSFASLFFQIGLFARGEMTGGLYMPYSYKSMKVCDNFVSYGKVAAQVMKSYLMTCAVGKEQYGWWENANLVVECISLAAGDSNADMLMLKSWFVQLVNVSSNIYEYDRYVRPYAQIELDVLSD